jgi:hypothetical protein
MVGKMAIDITAPSTILKAKRIARKIELVEE